MVDLSAWYDRHYLWPHTVPLQVGRKEGKAST